MRKATWTQFERTYKLAVAEDVVASMHPHPVFDGTLKFIDQINASGKSQPSPFLVGHEKVRRGLAIYRECAAAWLAKVDATSENKVWRISKLETTVPSSGSAVVAKLTTGWGPLPNQQVTIKVNNGAASCDATTNAQGNATCTPAGRAGITQVEATFAGSETSTQVNLPSTAFSGG